MSGLQPIRMDLFRFATIRTPHLLAPGRKRLGFIFHPEPSKSAILGAITAGEIRTARSQAITASASFTPLGDYEAVRALKPDLYEFAVWLAANRRRLTDALATSEWGDLDTLDRKTLLTLWDNVFYFTLHSGHPSIRQACLQMIIADNYLRLRRNPNLESLAERFFRTPRTPLEPAAEKRLPLLLKRVANAKVVIPMALSVERSQTTTRTPGGTILTREVTDIKRIQDVSVARRNTAQLRSIDADLRSVQAASKDAPATIERLLQTESALKPATRSYVKSLGNSKLSVRDARRDLDKRIRAESRAAGAAVSPGRKVAVTGGRRIRTRRDRRYPYTLTLRSTVTGLVPILTIDLGARDGYIASSKYSLQFVGEQKRTDTATELLDRSGTVVTLELFPTAPFTTQQSTYQFTARLVLDDGACIRIAAESSIQVPANGTALPCPTPDKPETEPDAEPEVDPAASVQLFGVRRLGIADLRKVEQEVCCYVPGEVSRIENILAREYKERTTRTLISSEVTEEESVEIEVETQSDTATTERNELLTEVAQVYAETSSLGYGASVGVSASFGGASVTAGAYIDSASSTSSSTSDSAAKSYAEEVVTQALERVLQKTSQKRTSRILEEYEETTKHGFDNREGDSHVTGVYRWIDVIYTNRLVNYGKRLMYEFLIPEPARLYRAALEKRAEEAGAVDESTTVLVEPVPLADNGVLAPTDITSGTYYGLARAYDVTLPAPPSPETKTTTQTFNPIPEPDKKETVYSFTYAIDPDYRAESAVVTMVFKYHLYDPGEMGTYFTCTVGNTRWNFDKDDLATTGAGNTKTANETKSETFTETWTNTLPIKAEVKNVHTFSITVELTMAIEDHVMEEWQESAYDTLVRAYEAQVAAYEVALAEAASAAAEEEGEATTVNTDLNRAIEQRELKRLCIDMIARPFGIELGEDFYTDDTTSCSEWTIPVAELTEEWETYASYAKFFEIVFEWESVSYVFEPYYWGNKCDWPELLQTTSAGDLVFEGFMQSGMARVLVPVRPGYEDAVCYYMESGKILSGGDLVYETSDDVYLSALEEMQSLDGFVEEEWQTRVPTTLTIVQGKSVYLEDEALPCCDDIAELGTGLQTSTALLGEAATVEVEPAV